MTTLTLHRLDTSVVLTADPERLTMPEMPAILSVCGGLMAVDVQHPDRL